MKHQEGYQPKAPPGVDMEKIKANPPRGGSGVRKKPPGTIDDRIKVLALKTSIDVMKNWPNSKHYEEVVDSATPIIADAIREAVREKESMIVHLRKKIAEDCEHR